MNGLAADDAGILAERVILAGYCLALFVAEPVVVVRPPVDQRCLLHHVHPLRGFVVDLPTRAEGGTRTRHHSCGL